MYIPHKSSFRIIDKHSFLHTLKPNNEPEQCALDCWNNAPAPIIICFCTKDFCSELKIMQVRGHVIMNIGQIVLGGFVEEEIGEIILMPCKLSWSVFVWPGFKRKS
jgi:hypothetical protein